MATQPSDRADLVTRGIALEYLTIGWNAVECMVALIAGWVAGSIALIGFGFDSAIESTSGAVLLWRLFAERRGEHVEIIERKALKFVGLSFILLATYVAFESSKTLWTGEHPEHSVTGMVLAVVSLIVMPLLAKAKRRTAALLNSAALEADSRQTSFCAYLSVILLGGLFLNGLFGLWWADPAAGLIMVPIIAKEGVQGLQAKHCICADDLNPA
jgi:divalent metal cation (Fe/Co/Zn/Cd) transporter